MRNLFSTGVLVLASVVCFGQTALAQNSFMYSKGKSFADVASYRMENAPDVSTLPSGVFYENAVPARQSTLSYSLKLPAYTRGVFFSRDDRNGDHQWPNNTNRLLPWAFGRLEELTKADYAGIPSNGRPSRLGDALLLQLSDGSYLFARAVSADNSISWFQVNADGTLTLYLSTLGEDALPPRAPVLLAQKADNAYEAIGKTYQSLIAGKEMSDLQRREDKTYYEAFEYLGWCTWEHYHFDIDETKILRDLDDIETSGLPIRYLLIDDGHLTNRADRLTSFAPNKELFPSGWRTITDRKRADKIKWMGLWHALTGYWQGIAPDNDLPVEVKSTLYSANGGLLPGKSVDNIDCYYRHFVRTLSNAGFDFLKVDNQSFTLPLYMGGTEAVRRAKAANRALETATHDHRMGLMNCMAQNILNTDHTRYSSVARVSIDYKKYNADMARSHLFQSYANTLLQGQTVWPDHDMFHSSDSISGGLMARSKALSGGPVYLSDSPKEFVKENILPLIDNDGKLFRPAAPAIPAPESILTNPIQDGSAYRVFAPTGDEAVSFICYNLNTSPEHKTVTATFAPADYLLRETFTRKPVQEETERLLLFDWESRTAGELTSEQTVALTGFTDRLLHLCPIRQGWAVVGIEEKFLSPATVQIVKRTKEQLVLKVLCPGTLRVWVEKGSERQLRSIPIDTLKTITIPK